MIPIPVAMKWQRRRVVDEAMDAYVDWRQACNAVRLAYSRWAGARRSEVALWYAAYSVALEREEHASERYAGLLRRAGELVAPAPAPTSSMAAAGAGWR